jgi:hypothetical protein
MVLLSDEYGHCAPYSDAHDEIQPFVRFLADLPDKHNRDYANECQQYMRATHPDCPATNLKIIALFVRGVQNPRFG